MDSIEIIPNYDYIIDDLTKKVNSYVVATDDITFCKNTIKSLLKDKEDFSFLIRDLKNTCYEQCSTLVTTVDQTKDLIFDKSKDFENYLSDYILEQNNETKELKKQIEKNIFEFTKTLKFYDTLIEEFQKRIDENSYTLNYKKQIEIFNSYSDLLLDNPTHVKLAFVRKGIFRKGLYIFDTRWHKV